MTNRSSWNKGMKGVYALPNRVMKNYIPGITKHPRSVPIGFENVKKGYIRVKISQPNIWRYKHIIIWEMHHGPLPKDHIVIFADKNKRNFNIDNLIAISRKELAVINRRGFIFEDSEITKVGVILAKIQIKTRDLSKKFIAGIK